MVDRMAATEFSSQEIDFLGIMGEAAAAEVLGAKINTDVSEKDDGTDLYGLDATWTVKTVTKVNYNLIFPTRSPMVSDYAVLVLPARDLEPGKVFSLTQLLIAGFTDRLNFAAHSTTEQLRSMCHVLRQRWLFPIEEEDTWNH